MASATARVEKDRTNAVDGTSTALIVRLGTAIRDRRIALNISQQELAE